MSKLDPFTEKRIQYFIKEFRSKEGKLPTLQDFAVGGINEDIIDAALKSELIEKFYVKLTNGTIVKGFKLKENL